MTSPSSTPTIDEALDRLAGQARTALAGVGGQSQAMSVLARFPLAVLIRVAPDYKVPSTGTAAELRLAIAGALVARKALA